MYKFLLLAAAGAVALPLTANAAVYNDLDDFAFNGFSQGLGACSFNSGCGAVPADRTGLGKAFDGSLAAGGFHSLGAYGFATFGLRPGQSFAQVLTSETTFGNDGGPSWPEKVGVFFSNTVDVGGIASWGADLVAAIGPFSNPVISGFAGGADASFAAVEASDLTALLLSNVIADGVLGAVFTNDSAAGYDIETAAGVAVAGGNAGSNGWSYQIDIDGALFGQYGYITFVDLTMSDDPAFWTSRAGDGWDFAELEVTAVPEPATAILLLAGLAGIGTARRRRR